MKKAFQVLPDLPLPQVAVAENTKRGLIVIQIKCLILYRNQTTRYIMKRNLLLLVLLFLISGFAWSQTLSPIGIWVNEEGKARFEIYECGDELCGKISSLKEPYRDGKPKLDDNNPNKKLQSRPLLGLEFLKGFEYVGHNKWDNGTIYDPESGKTYSCYMKMEGKNKMEVKGYIGFSLIGRSQNWTRVK